MRTRSGNFSCCHRTFNSYTWQRIGVGDDVHSLLLHQGMQNPRYPWHQEARQYWMLHIMRDPKYTWHQQDRGSSGEYTQGQGVFEAQQGSTLISCQPMQGWLICRQRPGRRNLCINDVQCDVMCCDVMFNVLYCAVYCVALWVVGVVLCVVLCVVLWAVLWCVISCIV